jgi:hypothetical protein
VIAELHEHVATVPLVCSDCARALRPGRSYFVEWLAVPAPDDDGDDFVCDGDAPVYCATCVATERLLDADPPERDPEPEPTRPRPREAPRRPPRAAPRVAPRPRPRRLVPGWLVVLAILGYLAVHSLAGPPNEGCPAGTTRENTSLVDGCWRGDAYVPVCQFWNPGNPGFAPPCDAAKLDGRQR